MYKVENGILYKDGKKVLCLGVAYFASFHEKKMAIPEDYPNRIEEMKRDIKDIKNAGFNMVRTSALGSLKVSENETVYNGDFIDEMLKEVKNNDLCSLVRIQGYSMCSKDYDDAGMIEASGVKYDGSFNLNFINDSIHHPGMVADNDNGTKVIAEHFKDDETIVGFLTYNEPHYPGHGVYDYNEHTIADYRKWLKKNNIYLSDNLDTYEPPRKRPEAGENLEDWIYWRLYSTQTLSDFLNKTADISKRVNTNISSLTCLTPNILEYDNFIKCCDYYDIAEGMDMLGITLYKNSGGADYYTTDMILSCAESAAATEGKHLWMVEQDASVDISLPHFNRQTYMSIGAGIKGIIWYQWRADYPLEDAPEANMYGFVFSDRTPTDNYEKKLGMVKLLDSISDYVVNSERCRDGVAILCSPYASMYSDATENIHEKTIGKLKNTYNSRLRMYYGALKKENITADIVKAKNLEDNKLGIKLLLVPEFDYLSDEEKIQVKNFQKNGGKVFVQSYDRWQVGMEKFGFDELGTPVTIFNCCYELSEVLEYSGIKPMYEIINKKPVGVNITLGEDFILMSVVNISRIHEEVKDIEIKLRKDIKKAVMRTPDVELELEVTNNIIKIPSITDGSFVLINF